MFIQVIQNEGGMADNKQQTEDRLSNDILKRVFNKLHSTVVNTINASSVIDRLFTAEVISDADMNDLDHISNPLEKCRRLMSILHNRKHPRAFIELRQAIYNDVTVNWLVKEIDEKCRLLASAPAQPQVARERSNTSLTSLDDIAKPNLVIDDFKKDVATLTTKNNKLVEDNSTLTSENSRLVKNNATLMTENNKLVEENVRLKEDNNRLRLKCLSAENENKKMLKNVEELNNKLRRVEISRGKSYIWAPLYSRKVEMYVTLIFNLILRVIQ